ncbi:hypothetical protein [Candidatus Nitrosotalea okcheonensis]|uniref:Uncharacterized protein n=1 Tax=Candidatus Nitrosotalea okcheonensis TaxID=1903276 RepID=A0A2H1FIS6_9ARCH|nr:hypothetical protein [Candidatus Nitrosotalea okcheonensis]SMH72648.1 protein of unknown function [Candidatus Nitrosotalea okcheonensis]
MPRGEYNTLTLRRETYDRILSIVHKAKKKNKRMYTSDFLEMLLDMYEKKSN